MSRHAGYRREILFGFQLLYVDGIASRDRPSIIRDMNTKTGWGILGTGKAARLFAEGLTAVEGAELRAVASHSRKRAAAFADEFAVPQSFSSYEALIEQKAVDVIYVATAHSEHLSNTLMCLENDKHVLCEKPLALNTHQAEEMIRLAQRKRLFLMEAMWMLTLPAMTKLQELVKGGSIGEITLIRSSYAFQAGIQGRLFSLDCGGGALMDIGVYGIAFAQRLLGREPSEIQGLAHIGESGVDERSVVNLRFNNGALASIFSSIRDDWKMEAVIEGTRGSIRVPGKISAMTEFLFRQNGDEEQHFRFRNLGNGYSYEALEAARCIQEGRLTSRLVPLDETVAVLRTMDQVREQWDLRFPGE